MDLQRKMLEQRQAHGETVAALRTTIATLQEDLFGDPPEGSTR